MLERALQLNANLTGERVVRTQGTADVTQNSAVSRQCYGVTGEQKKFKGNLLKVTWQLKAPHRVLRASA